MTSKIVVNNIEADSGINTVTIASPVALSGGITGTGFSVGTGTSISSPATNVLTLGTNTVERVRVDSSGRLGIGTNNPTGNGDQTTIHVHAADYPVLHLTNSTTGTAASDGSELTLNADGSLILRNRENSFIRFDTNGSERARVSAGGSFGINNNNPLSTLSVGSRTSDLSDSSLIFTAGGSSSGGEVLAATFCNTASGATNNSTAISFTCRAGDSQTAKIVAKQPSGASSPNTQLEFYVYGNSGSTKVVTFDQNGRVLMPYQPCFQASGNQSTTYTDQVVPFNVSLTNNGNHYSTSTYRFTAPVAGYYFFTLHAILGPAANGQATVNMRRNGTVVATMHRNTSSSYLFAWEQGACSAVLYLNVSDYVDCYKASDGTIYLGDNITGSAVYSAFNGHLIG